MTIITSSPPLSVFLYSHSPVCNILSVLNLLWFTRLDTRRTKDSFKTFTMFRRFHFLLVFCFVYHRGILPVGNITTPVTVTGNKGGNATLTCELKGNKIKLEDQAKKKLHVCETEECIGRLLKKGSCDVIIKNLIFSDAKKYFLTVYNYNNKTEQEPQMREFHLHIHNETSVKKGKQLKLDILWLKADKVERNSSGEWTELWPKDHGVRGNRLTVINETLIISNFTDTDTGTYRVLDYKGETWITVTVTESSPESDSESRQMISEPAKYTTEPKGDNSTNNTTSDPEQQNNWGLIVGVLSGVVVAVVAVVVLIVLIIYCVMERQRQRRQRIRGNIHEETKLHERNQTGQQAQDN